MFFFSERPQGASSLVDRDAALRPPSLLPQPQDTRTQLPHPRRKSSLYRIYHVQIDQSLFTFSV